MQQRISPPRGPGDVTAQRVRANLLTFGRDLRRAGLNLGSGQIISFVEAVGQIDVRRRIDFYHAARATLVTMPEQIPLFDAEFARFWRRVTNPMPPVDPNFNSEELAGPTVPSAEQNEREMEGEQTKGAQREGQRDRTLLAVEDSDAESAGDEDELESPPEDVMVFSAREALRKKDFAQFSQDEIAEARRVIARMNWRLGTRKTRRKERANLGDFIDYRATLRRSMRHRGVPIELRRRRRKERMRPLILICDISGSMDRYARLLLQFVHALENGLDSVEVFVFGTRLTRITRELRKRNVDMAIEHVVKSVDDWSGGTRIGESIKTFNFKWGRRVLRSGATVVMISDGWDRGDPALLATEMGRLQRSCRRLIWLNPLLGAPGYQPLTQGIRAALPFVDLFLPIHNLKSLEALADILGEVDDQPPVRAQSTIAATSVSGTMAKPKYGYAGEMMSDFASKQAGRLRPRTVSNARISARS